MEKLRATMGNISVRFLDLAKKKPCTTMGFCLGPWEWR
jgi:hypothetical protein